MYIRLVEAEARQGKAPALESVYEEYVVPNLEASDGCMFAGLLQSVEQKNMYASLTLWESKKKLHDYVEAGEYDKNLKKVKPYLEAGSEWKIRLSRKDTLEYGPVKKAPRVKSYPVVSDKQLLSDRVASKNSYLRVLSLQIHPGREKEFEKIYIEEIQPELEKTHGCRYSFLVDNTSHGNEMISITLWDDIESIKTYETGGSFSRLIGKVKETLAELYQWKMTLESEPGSPRSATSMEMDISKFTFVTGKKFR
ncbi:MAG: hypothetical protein GVY08_07365 [Bacteroidetes bacterium]|jgi:quinol monooxygenase YgiN|nr:hypothetical protein [Bacteroidota bacterium]